MASLNDYLKNVERREIVLTKFLDTTEQSEFRKYKNNIRLNLLKLHSKLYGDNRGMGTIELVLIIIVILGILVIFRSNIESLINTVFGKIHSQVNSF